MSQSKEGKEVERRGLVGENAGRTGEVEVERAVVVSLFAEVVVVFVVVVGYDTDDVENAIDDVGWNGWLRSEGLGREGRDCVGEDSTGSGVGMEFMEGVERVFAEIV